MKIPSRIRTSGHIYKVIKSHKFIEQSNIDGQADHNLLEIRLADIDKSGKKISNSVREEVFFHELLHCANLYFNDSKAPEETISSLSRGMYQILKDNKILK